MALVTIYRDNPTDATVVPNLFIDEYMKDANDAQLKIYLYLLRMMSAQQATSVADIADKFNHTEKDVVRALKYWQKQQLLDLDFDGAKNLVGIHIHDLSAVREPDHSVQTASSFVPRPVPVAVPASMPVPVQMPFPAPQDAAGTDRAETVESADSLPETKEEAPSPYGKPTYSADQLREFKSRQDTAQLLFIAESYIGKPLTASEMKAILYFVDVLHFSDDLVDYLIQYCVDRGKKDFKYIEKVAVSWAEAGITTPKQAQKASCRYDKNVYAIMNGLGRDGSPNGKEMEYISHWIKDYGFSTDIIVEACERTVLATDKHRFEYADGILSSWKNQNVQHKSDILKIDSLYRQRKKTAVQAKQAGNRFNQFAQNSYDFDVLEQELLSNN